MTAACSQRGFSAISISIESRQIACRIPGQERRQGKCLTNSGWYLEALSGTRRSLTYYLHACSVPKTYVYVTAGQDTVHHSRLGARAFLQEQCDSSASHWLDICRRGQLCRSPQSLPYWHQPGIVRFFHDYSPSAPFLPGCGSNSRSPAAGEHWLFSCTSRLTGYSKRMSKSRCGCQSVS